MMGIAAAIVLWLLYELARFAWNQYQAWRECDEIMHHVDEVERRTLTDLEAAFRSMRSREVQ